VYAAQLKARFCAVAQRLVQIREGYQHGLLGTTGTDAMIGISLEPQSPAAVISRSVLDSGTPNVGLVARWLNGSQTLYPRIIRQNDRFRSCYTIRTVALSVFRNIRMEAMIAFGHFEALNVASAWRV
jgi:hypothetical protein